MITCSGEERKNFIFAFSLGFFICSKFGGGAEHGTNAGSGPDN